VDPAWSLKDRDNERTTSRELSGAPERTRRRPRAVIESGLSFPVFQTPGRVHETPYLLADPVKLLLPPHLLKSFTPPTRETRVSETPRRGTDGAFHPAHWSRTPVPCSILGP